MPVFSGLEIDRLPNGLAYISRYVGEPNVPRDIQKFRRYVMEMMRAYGQPVVVRHMYNDKDVQDGIAEPSGNWDDTYKQVRNRDPLSHGIGFVSVEKSPDEWIDIRTSQIVRATVSPGANYVQAPRYRGFGPGILTYIVEPDAAEDLFRLDPVGALIKVQTARAFTGWYPDISDNDLLINVVLDDRGNIIETKDRYQAKMTNPVSVRGRDRLGRSEFGGDRGNSHIINQSFEMTLVPSNNVLMNVEVDR